MITVFRISGPTQINICKECGRVVDLKEGEMVVSINPNTKHKEVCESEETDESSIIEYLTHQEHLK